ncbi:molybdopterin molybdenumtransferase MoeA [Polymorphobacter glacialis]|uniref:Molybdopterin molybdenumtransferase n=2 Tax=Sandarakinorhabdus glacialis TaxID=1614636 RepID=A0A916ZPH9_9SPHN|nr:molybdopterin molybdenumtransferase MoeA [Polymorphobacter glacialis]
MAGLLDVDVALARLLDGEVSLPAETVDLGAARGRVLAGDLAALLTQPPFAASAMDGYAVRWDDLPGPWRVVGESAAGRGWSGTVEAGEALRIFTGAPLPVGADTVVVQEEIERSGDTARLSGEGPPRLGANIRRAAQDFSMGDVLAATGERLTPARIGLLAAGGHGSARVVQRPRVTLIATGDELVPPGTMPGAHQIVSSNGVMLRALFESVGGAVDDPGIVPDRREALAAALSKARGDVVVTIGGASVGDHDLVVPVLRDLGAEMDFWKLALRPGKPMLAGRLGSKRVIGLPGNPVSAYVCALLFVVPLLCRMGGRAEGLPTRRLPLGSALPANGMRRDYMRGQVTDGRADAFSSQDSALLGRLAAAQVLIVRLPGAPAAEPGEIVDCIALDSIGDVP